MSRVVDRQEANMNLAILILSRATITASDREQALQCLADVCSAMQQPGTPDLLALADFVSEKKPRPQ